MSSLREVKDRIDSVRSTLKITSAMKLVASSKLRKAQRTIEALRPYQEALTSILSEILGSDGSIPEPKNLGERAPEHLYRGLDPTTVTEALDADSLSIRPLILLAVSSNSSMCGAFNSNVIKKALEEYRRAKAEGLEVEVWAFGRKMADAFRKAGAPAQRDYSKLVAHIDYASVAEIAAELRGLMDSGSIDGATLVYNHFVSTGRQQVVAEALFDLNGMPGSAPASLDYILEPSREALLQSMIPLVSDLSLYAALLDSAAAEHAARMVAMQAATDNGEALLAELTLEYNKGRQQKITSEILDLVSGSAA